MRRRCSGSHGRQLLLLYWLVIACSWVAAAQAQQAPRTDPVEVAALNAILGRWGTNPPKTWNITGGDPCTGTAVDDTNIDDSPVVNPGIKCDCSFNNRTVCHITKLNLQQNYLTGPVPSFIGKLTFMQYL
ncbi:hypothetical protein OsJ_17928 [Oryza sativa Japonica Group]|uniref:Uncharacterized protein n=1 Tax=Oryza sativa subsp. japonica TaxID=39947 RepID=B9FK34_ORYSJ|nr:hypothetical protein OsJ_17928 [Oryza sativa Japonica Group]